MRAPDPPRFLECEDGHEYTERFARLLGGQFRFDRAGCFAEAPAAAGPDTAGLFPPLFNRYAE